MDSYKGMRAFVTVVQFGSFSLAAEKLGMSRPMITKYIADLEASLGTRLLNRSTRKMSLTEIGKDYLEHASAILNAVDALEERIVQHTKNPSGTLRITAPINYGCNELPAIVGAYLKAYPNINVTLDLDDRILDIIEHEYDISLRVAQLADSSSVARKLFDIPCYVCVSPLYLAEKGALAVPAELSRHNCLTYSNLQSQTNWSYRNTDNEQVSIAVSGNINVNNGDALCALAISGVGIILEPEFVVKHALENGSLIRIFPEYEWHPRALYAIYPSRHQLPLKTRNFIDFLVSCSQGGRPLCSVGRSQGLKGQRL